MRLDNLPETYQNRFTKAVTVVIEFNPSYKLEQATHIFPDCLSALFFVTGVFNYAGCNPLECADKSNHVISFYIKSTDGYYSVQNSEFKLQLRVYR